MSDLVQPASLASWPELSAEWPASNERVQNIRTLKLFRRDHPPTAQTPYSPTLTLLKFSRFFKVFRKF
jgi:hypothetical protein